MQDPDNHLPGESGRNDSSIPETELEQELVDVFEESDLSNTRRVSLGELKDIHSADAGTDGTGESDDDDFNIEERDYRPIRRSRDGKLGCLGGLMYGIFIICLSVVFACGAWMAASDVLALNKDDITATVTIPKNAFSEKERDVTDDDGNVTGTETVLSADIDYVADVLKDSGIIEYKSLFKLFAKFSNADTKIDPGSYVLSTNLDYRALIKSMQVGTQSMVVTTLTFPEGYTMEQIFQKLEDNDVCSKEELYEAAASYNFSYSFLEDAETGDSIRLEGFIFPNTYDFYQGEQASSVINKFLSALHYNITADMLKQCEYRGITFREAVTIASMIEKEAANDDERAIIASVIYNRLKAGMELGIDATILYEFKDFSGDTIPDSILSYDSPYNTRIYKGLPPSPICNPGMASIRAALQPADTGYYYYALDAEAGTHRFFTNYNEFIAFTATQNY